MIFNTPIFVAFFIIFYCCYLVIGNHRRWHLRLITTASLIFYAGWDWRFVPLLVGTGMLDFWCAREIEGTRARGGTGRRWLILSIICNLLVLGFFKYTNFLLGSITEAGSWFGLRLGLPHLDIILPAAISFYTFQSMSYTIDVYLESATARRDPLVFMSALSFFPHLLAGPIVRGAQLIPQFERGPVVTRPRMMGGLLLIGLGLFKKSVADLLAPIAGDYFAHAAGNNILAAWTGVLAFVAQVYGDFAGYSDIAIGLALFLGYDFPQNFNLPFLAPSPADFWRRWHMSLSTWLRDYLYLPLSAIRPDKLFLPLMLTMGLSGLWHGAGATYIVWGLYLGVLMYGQERLRRSVSEKWKVPRVLGILFTFYAVAIIGMTLFRAPSLKRGLQVIAELHTGALTPPSWEAAVDLGLVLIALITCHAVDWLHLRKRHVLLRPYVLFPLVFVLFLFSITFGIGNEFIYFTF